MCLRAVKGTEVAAGGRAENTAVERHQVRRLGSPAAVPRNAEFVGDDIAARLEKIKAPDHIPNFVGRGVPPEEDRADSGEGMGEGGMADRFALFVEVLKALPLVDRVLNVHRQPVHGAQNAKSLIVVRGLSFGGVPADHQHSGVRGRVLFGAGEEKRTGRVKVRKRFQKNFFGAVFRLIDDSGHRGIQRGPFPHLTELGVEKIAPGLLVRGNIGFGFQTLVIGAPPLLSVVDLRDQAVVHHLSGFGTDARRGQRRKGGVLFLRKGRTGERQNKENRSQNQG